VLIGHGPEKERLIKAAKEKNIVNVIFQPSIPKELIPSFLNKMDALYIGLQKQPLFRYGISPNKLMDYMMAKKPIIQAIEAGNDMVSDAGCGISIEAENPEALKNAVELLMSKGHAELEGMGDSGYQYVTRNHDYRVLAQNFAELID
ncbi:MAG: glycosyltransferase, partial [Gammaproteobacteria bacterium]|nr:glycosyltransferase [Gammaproteobacteria bacterium]